MATPESERTNSRLGGGEDSSSQFLVNFCDKLHEMRKILNLLFSNS